jgi:hypothetical protein
VDCWESATDGTSEEYGLSVVLGGQHCGNFGRAAALAKNFVINFEEDYKRSIQDKVNFGYQLRICYNLSKTTENLVRFGRSQDLPDAY